jgi:hypothetical protein
MGVLRRLLVLTTVAFVAAGCGETAPVPSPVSADDEAGRWAMLSVRQVALRDAWSVLQGLPYTRTARTEQHAEEGTLNAFAEREVAFLPARGRRIVAADSAGAFDYGHFKLFASEVLPGRDPVDVGTLALALSAEPLQPESAGAYRFRQRADTLLDGYPVQVLEARARPEAGDGHNVRRLTFYVAPETNDLVGLRLSRVDLGKFFREESEVDVLLRRLEDGTYAPAHTRVRSEIVMPFQPRRPVTTRARYTLTPPLLAAN